MIYTKFGEPIKISADCGSVTPSQTGQTMQLLQVVTIAHPESITGYQFAENLKADNGLIEINASASLAPRLTLDRSELAAAIFQAL